MIKNFGIREGIFIKDSFNQSFVFFKDDNKNLIFDKVGVDNSTTIIDKDVLDFSAALDENSKLHLLYIHKKGELVYCIYTDGNWQKKIIGKFDIQSNTYKYLTLYVHNNVINILYSCANLINLNLWSIEHIIKHKNKWQKHIVANIYSEKSMDPFYIDRDEFGNIHLVYSSKEYNNYNIYYLFYNTFTKRWTTSPTKISSSLSNNVLPYLFVDSHNNIHILWYSSNNRDYLLNYKRYSSIGDSKFQWKEINLPKILGYNYPALMVEKYNKLNIICISQEEIYNLVSQDYGITWVLDNKRPIEEDPVYLIKYYNHPLKRFENKINHYYGNIHNDNIYFYFDNFHGDLLDENAVIPGVESDSNEEEKETENLKNTLLDMQKQLNAIKEDMNLIKDKLQDIEEKALNRKGFFNIRW